MTKLFTLLKNLKTLIGVLSNEKADPKVLMLVKPKWAKPPVLVIRESTMKRKLVFGGKDEPKERPDIKWPAGELTFERLCKVNVKYSKEELRKAIGQKMEQSRKVIA